MNGSAKAMPVLLAVDDEPAVLAAVARDLRRQYGSEYRVQRAPSGEEGLAILRDLKLRNVPVALLLVDQRMPGMNGVEFIAQALELYPEARRVLLTAYADNEAAIAAINEVRLHHYLMKPWDPPEERLYPVLDDLLDDWQASFLPPFQGITVIGHRWSSDAHRVKEYLARNLVPYRWLDAEEDHEAAELLELAGADAASLPLVLFPDGSSVSRPDNLTLADRTGIHVNPGLPFYDLLIVGAGPAGLAAAVYGASEGLRTLLIEGQAPGGQAGMSSSIENYLGFPAGLSGGDLSRRAVAQARRFGAEILTPLQAAAVRIEDAYRIVSLSDGSELGCHALLVSTGVDYRRLEVPGADELAGSGVYYGAAISEALDSRGKDVFVVGGGNSAGQAAMYLSRYADSVTLLVRGGSLAAGMSRYLVDQLEAQPQVFVRPHSEVVRLEGDRRLEWLTVRDRQSDEEERLAAHALFIFIGAAPRTEWMANLVERDPQGYILSGNDLGRNGSRPRSWTLQRQPFWLESSVPGIFVAGDVRHRSVKRLASAVGEGAMAVQFIHQYLAGL